MLTLGFAALLARWGDGKGVVIVSLVILPVHSLQLNSDADLLKCFRSEEQRDSRLILARSEIDFFLMLMNKDPWGFFVSWHNFYDVLGIKLFFYENKNVCQVTQVRLLSSKFETQFCVQTQKFKTFSWHQILLLILWRLLKTKSRLISKNSYKV